MPPIRIPRGAGVPSAAELAADPAFTGSYSPIGAPLSAAVAGRWSSPGGNSASAALTQSMLYAIPVFVPRALTITGLAIEVGTGAGSSTVRLGVYSDNAGLPNALMLDATGGSPLDTATTGTKSVTGLSLAVPAGVLWLAAVAQGGAPTVGIMTGVNPYITESNSNGFNTTGNKQAHTQTGVTGALPASFTSGSTNFGVRIGWKV